MAKSGLTPLWTRTDVHRFFEKAAERAESVISEMLKRAGEEFVRIAREEGNYIDRTGNLRSSIGYVVLKNGKPLFQDFRVSDGVGSDKKTGKETVERLAAELAAEYNSGYVLIGMAGMKYAVYVEAMESKDVAGRAADRTEDWIRRMSRDLFNRLDV